MCFRKIEIATRVKMGTALCTWIILYMKSFILYIKSLILYKKYYIRIYIYISISFATMLRNCIGGLIVAARGSCCVYRRSRCANAPSSTTEADPRDHRAHLCTEIMIWYMKKILYTKLIHVCTQIMILYVKLMILYTSVMILYITNKFRYTKNDFVYKIKCFMYKNELLYIQNKRIDAYK